jgi:hypothetical protein
VRVPDAAVARAAPAQIHAAAGSCAAVRLLAVAGSSAAFRSAADSAPLSTSESVPEEASWYGSRPNSDCEWWWPTADDPCASSSPGDCCSAVSSLPACYRLPSEADPPAL